MDFVRPTRFFDAHLDLAYLAVSGRDMLREVEDCGGPHLPAACTLPSLAAGGIRACLGTVFTEMGGMGPAAYPPDDEVRAHAAGVLQISVYEQWAQSGLIGRPGTGGRSADGDGALCVGILVECADPIRTPDELPWWKQRGVVAIGMAWSRGSRYASGNAEPSCSSEHGLTDLGRELVKQMDASDIVHDVSHLSQRAVDELLSMTESAVVATHSNCRALLGGRSQRHLSDEVIAEIGRRGGVIGLNLFAPFVRHDLSEEERPTISDAVHHVEHICEIMGHRRGAGLGSDLDGGFSAARLPVGINAPRDLWKLGQALAQRGWSQAEVDGFAWGNWADYWAKRSVMF